MCTVTFLPLQHSNFILTSNRDEALARKEALPPAKYRLNGENLIYPKDAEAQGTWIYTSESSFTLCLLNGAFEKHKHQPPYRHSRGLVVLDFSSFNNVNQFATNYDFSGIEPFTLVIVEQNQALTLHELRWDGKKIWVKKLNEQVPHIWSSTTLYTNEVCQMRKVWFDEWLAENQLFTQESILKFHQFGGVGSPENTLVMQRENTLKTVSITSIKRTDSAIDITYLDKINNLAFNQQLKRAAHYA